MPDRNIHLATGIIARYTALRIFFWTDGTMPRNIDNGHIVVNDDQKMGKFPQKSENCADKLSQKASFAG